MKEGEEEQEWEEEGGKEEGEGMEGKGWGDNIVGKMIAMPAGRPWLNPRTHIRNWAWWLGMSALGREAETAGSLGLTGTTSLSYLGTSSSLRSPVSKSKVNH